jgi:hypothetical protein
VWAGADVSKQHAVSIIRVEYLVSIIELIVWGSFKDSDNGLKGEIDKYY